MELTTDEIKLLEKYRKEGLPWKGWPVLFWIAGGLFVLSSFASHFILPGTPVSTEVMTASEGAFLVGMFLLCAGKWVRRDQALRSLLLKLGETVEQKIEGDPCKRLT